MPTRMDVDTDAIRSRASSDHSRSRSPVANRKAMKSQVVRVEDQPPQKKPKKDEVAVMLGSKTGGAYIPPARLKAMQAQITDKNSEAYQRLAWEALKKTIHGLINKINVSNISQVIQDLFKENIVRGRGLFVKSCIDAQTQSPTFTPVYAALIAVINTKIGELILKRLVTNFRKAYRRNMKPICLSSTRFIAHLVNQQVADEVIALEIVTLLLENPTDDSLEVAIGFIKECGLKLKQVTPKGLSFIFDRLNTLMMESTIDVRVQYMIQVLMHVRKPGKETAPDGFADYPSVTPELDLVEEEDQFTHPLSLEENYAPEDILNVFHFDPDFEDNEEKYRTIRKDILGEADEGSGAESGSESEESEENEDETGTATGTTTEATIVDQTETNLVALRRTIYLTIQSSLDFEECCHKLLKIDIKPGQEAELCHMILDCCSQQRTYEKFYGLLAQRFCQINQQYVEPYQKIFADSYDTIHRLETNKLRNVGKFFAHLLFTDAISWLVLANVKLNEEDTTSSSRIFIKILFQELAEYMGMTKLLDRIHDPGLQEAFEGLFPRDIPKNTRFAINFFTSIGLGGLTDELRLHLAKAPKPAEVPAAVQEASSGSESDSEGSSSASDSESSSSSSEDERKKKSSSKRNDKRDDMPRDRRDGRDLGRPKVLPDREHHRERRSKERRVSPDNRSRRRPSRERRISPDNRARRSGR